MTYAEKTGSTTIVSLELLMEMSRLQIDNAHLKARVKELESALESLMDVQNGRPLATWSDWDDAMNQGMKLLWRTGQIVNGEYVPLPTPPEEVKE